MAPSAIGVTRLAAAVLLVALRFAAGGRKEPAPPLPPVVQALQPTGLRISVLEEEGMDLVIINANINSPLEAKETGQISKTMLRAQDGFFTLDFPSQQLKLDDTVFYWIYSSVKGVARNSVGHQTISELVGRSCGPSVTTVNGRPVCKGTLIFDDNFKTLNGSVWTRNKQFSGDPDLEFNTYVDDDENSFVDEGFLHLKPTAVKDEVQLTTPLKIEGCSFKRGGDFCERKPFSWNILPPARSAWLSTAPSFAFRFGRVEVRAKAASGDWLHSRIFLEPRDQDYGPYPFDSGRIELMRLRGNADLRPPDGGDNYGANQNRVQSSVAACFLAFFYHWEKNLSEGLYTDKFHTHAVVWTPREIIFEEDGEVIKKVTPPLPDGFLGTAQYRSCENSLWEKGTFMAPFDKEFYVNLALLVGGFHVYKDGSVSGNYKKPYHDRNPRAALNFWQARDHWLPTWKTDFEIDYVKVWAL